MAPPAEVLQRLERVSRQYFQLLDPEQLQWPPGKVLKDAQVQAWLYEHMFSEGASQYSPPDQYRLRVLKQLVSIIEHAVEDPEEDEISDDLMGELSSLLAVRMPPEALAVQDKSYVTYTFTKDDESLPVTMLESRAVISSSGTTGLRTWEAALHLGAFLRSTEGQRFVKGKQMLELGAGTGLVSLLCAKHLGAQHVMATDGSELVVDAIRSNIFLNGLDNGGVVEAAALKWGYALSDESIEEDYNNGTLDVVVGADVTYDKSVIPSLVSTLWQLLRLRPSLDVLIAATVRNEETLAAFERACTRNRLQVEDISFNAQPMEEQLGPFYSTSTPIRILHIRPAGDRS